jgi:hypothetical protein
MRNFTPLPACILARRRQSRRTDNMIPHFQVSPNMPKPDMYRLAPKREMACSSSPPSSDGAVSQPRALFSLPPTPISITAVQAAQSGRQRKLDLEIRLRLLIIVRHAAGRHKREIDRSSAPLLNCGAADRISVAITNTPEAGLQARAAWRARRQAGRAPGGPRDAVGGGGHNSKPVEVL